MAGTFATFAGIPCLDVQFARSRGWESDVTVVEVPAGPAATLEKPKTLSARPLPTQTRPPAGPLGPVQVPAFIPHEGSLYLAEVSHGDERWDVTIGPLFVARCEAVKTPDGSQVVRYRLSLVDERYFWPRGLMPRWSFNRRRGDGTIAADSLKPDGSPFSRREVADEAVRALFRRPQLAHAPVEWQSDRREHSFEPFAPAVAVLSTMANEDGLEAPCLRMDNTVAFYRAGEGKVGFAPGGQGANAEDFPPHVKVYKGGSGQGHVAENGYPEDYALVVGGVRIASVAIDAWEPVLVLNNGRDVVPLTEKRVRFMTEGRYGLEWLHRFILQPSAYQSVAGVSDEVLEVFRTQAYRLFRLPGAVVEIEVPTATPGDFGAVYDPGPNAHLLPLLDRAETIAGRRLAPKVEASRFKVVHQALRGGATEGQVRLAEILKGIADLRSRAPARPPRIRSVFSRRPLSVTDVFKDNMRRPFERGVSLEEMQQFLDRAREIESYRAAPGGDVFADQLALLTKEQLAAEEGLGGGGGRTELFDLAQEILQLEKTLEKQVSFDFERPISLQKLLDEPGVRDAFMSRIAGLLTAIERERQEQRARERVGGQLPDKPAGMTILVNVPRAEDVQATVYDAEQGIVQTSELAAHVVVDPAAYKPGDELPKEPTNFSHARAVPCPVRVTFGAVIRPRTDRPQATRVQTGESLFQPAQEFPHCKPEPNAIPHALTDQETYYTAAFRRTGRGAGGRLDVAELMRGNQAKSDQCVRLYDPDMIELVPLENTGNRHVLDERAERWALSRFLVADQVTTTRTTLGRPWPVNCDGLVSAVEINMRHKDGAPCGFETVVVVGGKAAFAKIRPRPRTGFGTRVT